MHTMHVKHENACDACLPFGAHALHVTHDKHVTLSSSHV